jgi:Na+/glutamate symporter
VVPSSGGSSPNADGLSTGAKVGIAIGTVVGVFGLVLGGYLLARRGKEDLNTHPGTAELNNNGIHEIPQLETKERPGELEGRGLPDERVHEIG